MQTKPFTFENFAPDTAAKPFVPLVREEVPPEKRAYTSQDILLAERKGHERGYQEGLDAGKKVGQTEEAETNRIAATALAALERKFEAFFQNSASTLHASAKDTTNLALSIARKVAGDALAENPHAAIEAMVHQCMDLLFAKADIVLTLHPDVLEPVQKKLEAMADRHNFKGKIHYKTDPALQPNDCAIAWQDGGARLDSAGTWQKIEAILKQQELYHEAPAITAETLEAASVAAPAIPSETPPETPQGA